MRALARKLTVVFVIALAGVGVWAFQAGVFDGGGAHLGPRGIELYRHLHALKSLDDKLQKYVYDHSAQEAAGLEGKTIEDFVSLGILTREDADYVHEHRITFDGYHGDRRVPMFTEVLDAKLNHYRLVIYSDGNGDVQALRP